MEIPALATVQFLPQTGEGTRASAPTQNPPGNTATASDPQQLQTAASRSGASPQEAKQSTERKNAGEARRSQSAGTDAKPALGRIRFEMQDGTRIAKFFDTKDVLIYQVPPEGKIYLIKVQEAAHKDQVETSA